MERPPVPPAVQVEPTSTTPISAFEDPGTIVIESDSRCGGDEGFGVALAGGFALPEYADAATVLLNGWRLGYSSGDQDVHAVGASIEDVTVDPGAINWVARGDLYDQGADDAMQFCYVYTVIGWDSRLLDAVAVNDAVNADWPTQGGFSNRTALVALSQIAETAAVSDRRVVVPLPRGFRSAYAGDEDVPVVNPCFECPKDRHVLQLAYNMDHNESFVERKGYGTSVLPPDLPPLATDRRIDVDYATWESSFILKDNSVRHDVFHHESVAILGGNDIGVVRPPFTILPAEDVEGLFTSCVSSNGGVKTEEYVVEDIPFDYAVPMLTGWDLTYECDAQEVKEIGVWLEDFSYEKAPDAPTGTLRYTLSSVLRDKGGEPTHSIHHKVNVLGLNGRLPTDLVPRAGASGFCVLAPGGLRVTVANVGADAAPASVTRIQFAGGAQEDLPTPPLAKDAAITLDPVPLPLNCAGCGFGIRVDQTDLVAESDEANNSASGICVE
jgi:hypothetical protein